MTPKPRDPADFRPLALGRTADIIEKHGWWFRYTVHRLDGIGIPENGCSSHRTLEGARRAAQRWCSKNSSGEHVEIVSSSKNPMPATAPDNVIAKR